MRPRRRVTIAVTAAVAAVAVGSLSGAAAAPSSFTPAAASRAGIPPQKGGSNAATLVDGKATVRKLRTTVTLPRVLLHAYASEKSTVVGKVLKTITPSWAVTHKGRHPHYGVFPVAHTTILGFGSIPITASLHLNQIVHNGVIVPVTVTTSGLTVPPFTQKPAVVTGLLNIRVSNVKVDQVPAHVGPNCHSATPLKLRLIGNHPAYDLFTGGPLQGAQTIPPFIDCGTHGDNLDPLLNGMISGPGNMLRMQQGNLASWDQKKPSDCSGCKPPKHH